MIKCGLLGRHLTHSYSPQIHSVLGGYPYCLFEKEPEMLEDFLKHGDFTGINVTIPYKKAVLPYCDKLTPIAARLGAVNTIVRQKDGSLLGHNSDYFGFCSMMARLNMGVAGKKALVLGSGGASGTVAAVLSDRGAKVVVISRNGENNYHNLEKHTDAALIVNATPVGMYPNNGHSLIDLDRFSQLEAVADLIYNPARTKLLTDAQALGLKTQNGLWMLVAQAKESAELFTGRAIDDQKIAQVYCGLKAQMENMILIGMPGCGKSTVAAALAKALNKPWVDADAEIEKAAGCSIPEIFEKFSESGFRKVETDVLEKLGKESGHVIATGGGCVTRKENYPSLHQNGNIFWLQRDTSKLPTEGRPLSVANDLTRMYRCREPLYRQFADHIIDNNGTVENTLKQIIDHLRYSL